jgi:hypothetical protein
MHTYDHLRLEDLAAIRAGADVLPRLDAIDVLDCDARTLRVLLSSVNDALGVRPKPYISGDPSVLGTVRRWLLETLESVERGVVA